MSSDTDHQKVRTFATKHSFWTTQFTWRSSIWIEIAIHQAFSVFDFRGEDAEIFDRVQASQEVFVRSTLEILPLGPRVEFE